MRHVSLAVFAIALVGFSFVYYRSVHHEHDSDVLANQLAPKTSDDASNNAPPNSGPGWKRISQQTEAEIEASLSSFKKLDDHPFFEMTFVGDYVADTPVAPAQLESAAVDQQAGVSWACSIFVSYEKGTAVYGRNFDWQHNPAMLLKTNPSEGYASISMVDVSYLGFEKQDSKFDSPEDLKALLYAPMIPFDGMNECGLTVGMAAVGATDVPHEEGKPSVGGLQVIRLMLDQAKDVKEALAVFRRYNIAMIGGPNIHYLIADRHRNSVLIELKDGKANFIHGDGAWQAATNFYLTGQTSPLKQCHRFAKIHEFMSQHDSGLTPSQTLELLEKVKQGNTQWSVVYDMMGQSAGVSVGMDFDQQYEFKVH